MHSETHQVDVAIIGAGTAGMAAYRAARARAERVLLIEGGAYGTTCARVGCMPSKLLIAAAEAAHHVHEAHKFGIGTPMTPVVDGARVMARVRAERDRFVGFVLETIDGFPQEDRWVGQARFLDAHTLEVGDRRVDAKAIVIATGSRPKLPPLFDGLGDRLVVNDDVFNWETLPRSVAVFGPGVIGLELGQALHRLGVKVRIMGLGGFIGPLTDPEVKAKADGIFKQELAFSPGILEPAVRREGDAVRVSWKENGEAREEVFEYVLAAVGRTPNLDGLGMETTGLELDARGIPVFDPATMQCGSSGIFIAGDVNADRPLLHEAADEGRIAGDNAARFPHVAPGLRRSGLSIIFSDPNIAMVGSTFASLRGRDIVIGRVSFDDQGRSRVMGVNRGVLNVYADPKTGRFLGAEMIGPRAEHLAHLLAWAHQQSLTIGDMLNMPFYHPVVEEGVRTALRDAAAKLSR